MQTTNKLLYVIIIFGLCAPSLSLGASGIFNLTKLLPLTENILGETTGVVTRPAGQNVITTDGTIYFISKDGQRRAYSSAGAFLSYGFNTWANVVPANEKDLLLPVGALVPPRDGSIICSDRGTDKGTCYVISEGSRVAYTSEQVFKAHGYDFSNALSGDVSFLPEKPFISDPDSPHAFGAWVSVDGTVYMVTDSGLWGVPSEEVLTAWGVNFKDVVSSTAGDRNLPVAYFLPLKNNGELNPLIDLSSVHTPSTYNFDFLTPVTGGPDFIITDISIAPAQPVAGQPATLKFSIKNIGQSQGERPRYTFIHKPPAKSGKVATGECLKNLVLQPGQSCADYWQVVWENPGPVELNFIANTPNTGEEYKPEADYNNNKTNFLFTVRAPTTEDALVKMSVLANTAVEVGQMYFGTVAVEATLTDLNLNYLTFSIEGSFPQGIIPISVCTPTKPRTSNVLKCVLGIIGVPKTSGSFPVKIRGVAPSGESGSTTMTVTVTPSTITPVDFALLTPASGEQIQHGQPLTISWSGGNANTTVDFALLRQWNAGEVPEGLLNDYLSGVARKNTSQTGGSFDWVVPPMLGSGKYYLFACLSNTINTSTCLATDFTKIPINIIPSSSADPYNDAQRLQEISRLATALELYFNDRNMYPQDLSILVPAYLTKVPSAPATGGACTVEQNNYKYTRLSNTDYTLNFCLAGNTGSYVAGSKTLGPAGIR